MNVLCSLILAALSIWDYPARYPMHERLRYQLMEAVREKDTATMEETSRKGVKLLPDDPTWHYNLACALAYRKDKAGEAFDELETAIDLGYRDRASIEKDEDLKQLEKNPRYKELLEYADFMSHRPIMTGPQAVVDATGEFGQSIALGEQNLGFDFDVGCFHAKLALKPGAVEGGNVGDLYMNRDGKHSPPHFDSFFTNYLGLTMVKLDSDGRQRGMDMSIPNIRFPYPTFGNASLAITQGPYWRSLPRALMTTESAQLKKMMNFYLSNQTWVFPSCFDTAPVGTNGDVIASITPYWIMTAGRSFSDAPYLGAALEASRSFVPAVKEEIVKRGLLAPTIQTLIRKSLRGVVTEADYISAKAHPTALPPNAVELGRLKKAAKAMTKESIPPLAIVSIATPKVPLTGTIPELTYATAFAWAFVLRADQEVRVFDIFAKGAEQFEFVKTHGDGIDVRIERLKPNVARVTLNRSGLSPTNRVDIAVFGRNANTGWGAPSYISFARMDPTAPYSDPALTVLPEPEKK